MTSEARTVSNVPLGTYDAKVTVTEDGDVQHINIDTSALPAGAATEATLSAISGKVTACDTGAVTVASSALPAGAATETTLAEVKTSQGDTKAILTSISTLLAAGTLTQEAAELLGRIVNLLSSPMAWDQASNRMRVTASIESGTVSTVSMVTNQANIGGISAQAVALAQDTSGWALCDRSRIS